MLQDLFVDYLIGRLALWQELAMYDAPHIEKRDQHNFDFVMFSSASAMMLETSTNCSGAWFLGHSQKSMPHHLTGRTKSSSV